MTDLTVMRPPNARPDQPARRTISEIHAEEFDGIDTEHFEEAVARIKHGRDRLLFITGGAGTGKSTLVRYIQYYFAHVEKNTIATATVAPTGVAAMSAHGETIHSFFHFPPRAPDSFIDKIGDNGIGIRRDSVMKKLDVIIIDEISMVRADMFDAIEKSLRVNCEVDEPFGGIRVVLVGDLLQLPPIVKRQESGAFGPNRRYPSVFFTGARFWEDNELSQVKPILLRKVFRQTNDAFVRCLNDVRIRKNLDSVLEQLQERRMSTPSDKNIITLVPTRRKAAYINSERLNALPEKKKVYEGYLHGKENVPEVDEDELPAPLKLELKIGAQVMMVRNDAHRRRWVNGTLAKVIKMRDDSVVVKTDNGGPWDVPKSKWFKYRLAYDHESGRIVCEEEWSFEQIPVVLGWAATVHKCQGITLDRVIVDMDSGSFCTGQTYVALSRCRSMNGLYLANPLREADIKVNDSACQYYLGLEHCGD